MLKIRLTKGERMNNNSKIKILICETEPIQRDVLERVISRRWDVQVLKTENIEEAFLLINAHHPSVSLIGFTMWDARRINNFASKIKKFLNKTKMIFLHTGLLDKNIASVLSADDCLEKPYGIDNLVKKLKTELGPMKVHTVNAKFDKPIVKIREMIASLKIENEAIVYRYDMEKSLGNSTKEILSEAIDLLRDSSTGLMDILREVEKLTETSIKPQLRPRKHSAQDRSRAKNKIKLIKSSK